MAVLAASVGCMSNVQDTGPQARDALSVTAVRAYRGGLVLATAEAGTAADRPVRVLVSRNHGATFADITPAGMRGTDLLRVDDIAARGPARFWLAIWDADSTDETVYRTSDGGTSWHVAAAPQHDAAAGAMDSVSFVDSRHGWLVQQMPTGPVSVLYRTTDSGSTWQPVNRRLPQVAPVVPDAAAGLWQGGGFFSGRLIHSTDGGHTWASADLGMQPGRVRLVGVPASFSGQMLVATSSLDHHDELLRFYRTRDGVTWSRIAGLGPLSGEPALGGFLRRAQLVFATSRAWWVIAADPGPTVYRTTDAGQHWTSHRLPSAPRVGSKPFLQITSSDARRAWATITGRDTTQLLATTDGGSTWTDIHLERRLRRPPRAEAARLPHCRPAQLTARVASSGSEASQPFVTIALGNHSATACSLRGYPALSAFGHRPGGSVTKLAIRVRRGPIYERRDPGPRAVALSPGATASFSIGTATAYDPPLVTLTRLLVRLPGETAPLPAHVQMSATGPRGRPIPVGVTAVQAGAVSR